MAMLHEIMNKGISTRSTWRHWGINLVIGVEVYQIIGINEMNKQELVVAIP